MEGKNGMCLTKTWWETLHGSQDQVLAETWEWCRENMELLVHITKSSHWQSWASQNTEPIFLTNSKIIWQIFFFCPWIFLFGV